MPYLLPALVEYLLSYLKGLPGYSICRTYFLHWLSISWALSKGSLVTVHAVLTSCTGWVSPELPLRAPWLQYMLLSIYWAFSMSSQVTALAVLTSCTGYVIPELPLRTPWLQYCTYCPHFLHWLSISRAPSISFLAKYLLSTLVEYFLSSLNGLPGETVEPAEDSVSAKSHPRMFTLS